MNFPRAAAAAAAGLRSAFAFPVLAGGRFMGVIELLDRSARQADRNLVETMTGIGGLLGELLERERQDDERDRLLRRLETERARLEAVQRRMPAGVLVADAPSGRVVAGNDKLDDLVGAPLTDDAEGERFLTYPFRRVDGTPYDHHEMPFAEAARTGTVIENAELEFQQPDGEIRLVSVSAAPVHDRDGNVVSAVATFHDVTDRRRAEDRHRFLSEASAVLASSLDHNATLAAVARLAIGVLGDVIGVHLIGADGKLRQVVAEFSDPELAIVTERIRSYGFDAAANEGVARVLRKGTSVVYEEVDAELLRAVAVDDEHLALLSRLRARSAMLIPLVSGPRVLGALSFVSLQPQRVFDHDAVSLAEELGRRAGVAVANARLYERERAVAAALQASLLPRRLPQVPGLELAARFHPGGEGVEVGGDFYDAFPIGAEAAALVVGDVCGKGAEAAALTAQFRYTARALSGPGRDPGTVLGLVDAKVQEDDGVGDRFCTAVYALVERGPHGFACSVASAGHPLPLVVRASGAVEELACSGSLLFVLARPTYQVVSFTLRPGDSLVLYTDGVTEARGEHGWFGADRLRSLLASRAGASADELAGAVADAALAHSGGRADDDIAVLVAVARP
jgi:PAS domain S-box-containing protein